MKRVLSRAQIACVLALFAGSALAQSTQSVTITAAVAKTCAVTAPTSSIDFAAPYDPNSGSAATASGGVTIQCTKGTSYEWLIKNGQWSSGGTRRLRATDGTTTDFLNYTLEASSDGTNFTVATSPMAAPLPGAKSNGRALPMTLGLLVTLPINQDVASDLGGYSDTVDVEIYAQP